MRFLSPPAFGLALALTGRQVNAGSAAQPPVDAVTDLLNAHVDHRTVLAAVDARNKRVVDSFLNENKHGDYLMAIDYAVHEHTISLDTQHEHFLGFTDSGDMEFSSPDTPDVLLSLHPGTFIFGSHEGQWNAKVDGEHARRQVRSAATGITLSRKVVKVERLEDSLGSRLRVKSVPCHPQEAVADARMSMSMNFTKLAPVPHRERSRDRRLDAFCDESCKVHEYYSDVEGANDLVNICDQCFEYKKQWSALNFNWDDQERKAAIPEFNLVGGEGVTCKDCYAYIGSSMELEFAFSGLSVTHFKVSVGGEYAFNYNIQLDNPTFPVFYHQSVYDVNEAIEQRADLTPNLDFGLGYAGCGEDSFPCFVDASITGEFEIQGERAILPRTTASAGGSVSAVHARVCAYMCV